MREYAQTAPADDAKPGRELLRAGYEQFARSFDGELGGFGKAPKFPRPVTLNFLLRFHALEGDRHALDMSLFTLRKMADGGMHDHLGGGFHRYSVDKFWHIPHFEKMLYDQAQLALAYLDAFQITHDPLYESVARDILDYVRRDMTAPEGGFYSAEDADSFFEHGKPEHGEGAFYVWTKKEIDDALRGDAEIFDRVYGVEEQGNAPRGSDPHGEFTGRNTLIQRMTRGGGAFQKKRGERRFAGSLAEETFRDPQRAPAPAPRRQNYYSLERSYDLGVCARVRGAR